MKTQTHPARTPGDDRGRVWSDEPQTKGGDAPMASPEAGQGKGLP